MSYAAAYPTQAPPPATPPAAPRRPLPVQLAAALLALMALAGLGYAIATLAVVPGVVDRFRAAAGQAESSDLDGYVTVVWTFAAIGTVLAVILVALYIVLALGLRRGSNGARIATWVVCGLGVLFGCGSAVAVGAQRAGDGTPGTLGFALSGAYPDSWIGLNVALAIAQVVGYALVALLLVFSPAAYFRRPEDSTGRPAPYVALPTYGSANTFAAQPGFPAAAAPGPSPSATPVSAAPAYPGQPYLGQAFPGQPAPGQPHPGQPPFPPAPPSAPAPSAEDHAMWSRPAPEAPPQPSAAAPTSPSGPPAGPSAGASSSPPQPPARPSAVASPSPPGPPVGPFAAPPGSPPPSSAGPSTSPTQPPAGPFAVPPVPPAGPGAGAPVSPPRPPAGPFAPAPTSPSGASFAAEPAAAGQPSATELAAGGMPVTGPPIGGLPASAEDEGTDTIPRAASAPTPMAPPYAERSPEAGDGDHGASTDGDRGVRPPS